MKIAIVAVHAGYVNRGAERWAYELWRRFGPDCRVFSLARTEWTTRVPGLRRDHPVYRPYLSLVKLLRPLRLGERLWRRFDWGVLFFDVGLEHVTFARHLYSALASFNPDAVMHCAGPIQSKVVARYSADHGIPFLGVSGAGASSSTIRDASRGHDIYMVQTPSTKRYILERLPDIRVEVIPNGVDVQAFSPNGRRYSLDELRGMAHKAGCVVEHPLILSTSAMDIREKRIDALIEAASRLDQGTLILAGNGPDREHLVQMGDQLLNERFLYVGDLPFDAVAALTNMVDVVCLPSVREAFGTVLIEGMASGKPVVANENEDTRWIVGEQGGLLTDLTDIDKFALALRKAAERDWGDGPRRRAEQFGSWDKVASEYMRLLCEAVEGRKARYGLHTISEE